ncbi:hypothetical protein [Amycolatopsis keratiniphila]|uniref:Kinase n=1 Tax=Amycolatopsis keratiniphila TaxID=129921 RepID=R4T6B8_9PSEU|nr:hypothetical protein [Amycolatopsis keratiniphila]AGM07906.1 hypothetical protein AORI_5323 [Amycolatopsis keratiniphila]
MTKPSVVAGRDLNRRTAEGTAFGTFGELLQGAIDEPGVDFLVTLPITLSATASFEHDPAGTELWVQPSHKVKSRLLAQRMLQRWGAVPSGTLRLTGNLPEGKGLASSSADLVATARAVAAVFGKWISGADIEDLIRGIEPSDGVMHHGVVAFHHRRTELRRPLGTLPPLAIVAVDEGGMVDTIEFNQVRKPYTAEDRHEYGLLLDRLTRAIGERDLRAVGEVATRSAVLNQRLRAKRSLGDMVDLCARVGGLGVVVAHSGTMVGILLDEGAEGFATQTAETITAVSANFGYASLFRTWRPGDGEG